MTQPKHRITPSRAILYAVILTAFIAYLQSILGSLGAADHRIISPFFSPSDLFADYFKLIGSYPAQAPVRLESWVPSGWAATIQEYLSSNSYGSDPSQVGSRLSNFGMPPLAQVFYIVLRRACFTSWPFSSFLLCIAGVIGWLTWCLHRSAMGLRARPWILPATLLLYPFVFAFTRGNISCCISFLAVISAFLSALRPDSPAFVHPLLLSIGIGIRPNNLLLLPLCVLVASLARPHLSRLRLFVQSIGIVTAALLGVFTLLPFIHPSFSFHRFLESYHWISSHYDLDPGNAAYVSSPLQGMNLALAAVLRSAPAAWFMAASGLLRTALIGSGVSVCLYAFHLCAGRELSIPRSMLLSIVGMAIATPWFVDYHWLVLLAPLFCCALLDQADSGMLDSAESIDEGGSDHRRGSISLPRPTNLDAGPGSHLSLIDYYLIITLLLPKSLPLISSSATLGVLINPLLLFTYAGWMLVPRLRRIRLLA